MFERLSALLRPKLSAYDLIRYGQDYYELKDYEKALVCFNEAILRLPDNATIYIP